MNKKENTFKVENIGFKYTVTIKLRFPDDTITWASRHIIEARNETDAELKAKIRLAEDEEYRDCKIIEMRISPYERGDEYRYIYDTERWELEEETKVAPAKIARALENIAFKFGPAPRVEKSSMSGTMILFAVSVALSSVSLLLWILQGLI